MLQLSNNLMVIAA